MERHLLLVDDEANVLSALSRLLRGQGYQIHIANGPAAALPILEQFPVGVVVSDQRMPEMDGTEFLARVRERWPDTVRILLTAYAEIATVAEAINKGAVFKFLLKPHDDDLLKTVLAEAFQHHELLVENQQLIDDMRHANAHLQQVRNDLQNNLTEKTRELGETVHYDGLTRLPNRLLLRERVEQAVAFALRNGGKVAVVVADLDRFKLVNEMLGSSGGDQLLLAVAERFGNCMRACDTIARPGGDEFIFLLPELGSEHDITAVTQRILGACVQPFSIGSEEIYLTCSIGVSVYPYDGDGFDVLMKNAEAAMYHAKDQGRNNCQFYAREMNAMVFGRLMLETGLRHALERNEFELYYQPQIDFQSRRIVGMEALLRWRHPDLGFVPTNEVITLLEETGLIEPVGEWILRTACTQAKQWLDAGLPPLRMSVNLSARQFKQADLADRILRVLAEVGLDPALGRLDLELTESMIMQDAEMTLRTLRKLTDIGLKLSIDDFGTGYSSLSYLRRFPIHTLKIDQSFTRDLGKRDDAAAIVTAIIALSHGLKLNVIAEGVETQAQFDILRGLGCDEYQGYLFSRPVPAQQATELLQSNSDSLTGIVCRVAK